MDKQKLIATFQAAMFGASGPVAKYLGHLMGVGPNDPMIEFILQALNYGTPLAAAGFVYFTNTLASKIAAIKEASPEVQAQVVAAVPAASVAASVAQRPIEEQTQVAQAMTNEAVISATASIPEVAKVLVKRDAVNGAARVAADPKEKKVDFESGD